MGLGLPPGGSTVTKTESISGQNGRVLELEHPAVLLLIVDIENSQAFGPALSRPAGSPNLEGSISLRSAPIAQVKGIKDQRLFLGIENAAKSPPVLAFAVYVEHVNNMEIAGTHQVMDVTPRRQQAFLPFQTFCLGA